MINYWQPDRQCAVKRLPKFASLLKTMLCVSSVHWLFSNDQCLSSSKIWLYSQALTQLLYRTACSKLKPWAILNQRTNKQRNCSQHNLKRERSWFANAQRRFSDTYADLDAFFGKWPNINTLHRRLEHSANQKSHFDSCHSYTKTSCQR